MKERHVRLVAWREVGGFGRLGRMKVCCVALRGALWFFFCCLAACWVPGHAQAQATDWGRVQRLAAGTDLRVRTGVGAIECAFVAADESSVTCVGRGRGLLRRRESRTLARADVLWIKRSRRALSTVAVVAVGVGTGAAIGAGVDASTKGGDDPHLLTGVFGMLGGVLSIPFAARSDVLAGPYVYRAK
jgi:hypothetical protein